MGFLERVWSGAIDGWMGRRLLVNWRVPMEVARGVLPAGLRPVEVEGFAIAGVCVVRMERVRPEGWPGWMGLASENAATRMAVEWDVPPTEEVPCGVKRAVLIFRRDTGSWVTDFVGTRCGYGAHSRTKFVVMEDGERVRVRGESADGLADFYVDAEESEGVNEGSLLEGVAEAGDFFRGGECGYSPGKERGVWNGVRLDLHRWDLRAMRVREARSGYLEELFGGAAVVDSAFIMRGIPHTWTPIGEEFFGEMPGDRTGGFLTTKRRRHEEGGRVGRGRSLRRRLSGVLEV